MKKLLTREPIRIINDVPDFVGNNKDEYGKDFDKIAKDRGGLIRLETEIYKNCIDLTLPLLNIPHPEIIDVGCGDGYIINSLSGHRVGIDFSITRLNHVSGSVKRLRVNVEDIPISSSYFDIAICTDVFEHVKNEKKLVSEIWRILKPNGYLFFGVPWEQDLSVYNSKEYRKNFKLYACRHRRSVNNEIINNHFKGFSIKSETKITAIMKYMKLKPYAVNLILFQKNDSV